MISLRPYQEEGIESVLGEWKNGRNRTLLVLPTGTGKTVCFSKIAESCVKKGERVMVLAHRWELLKQAQDKIEAVTGIESAIEKAEMSALESDHPITVASMQTLVSDKRLNQYNSDYFGTIIVDEAHHIMSDGYQKIMNHFPHAKICGVTATADRGDKKDLGKFFDSLAYEYTLSQAIRDGYLVPIKALTVPLNIDITGVQISQGDYQLSGLGNALDPYLEQIADEMAVTCKDRKTVVFLPLIETSKKFRDLLIERGMLAEEVNGMSDDREQILADYENGKYQVLCNSMLLTEGWDCPPVDCIVVLRPTKVRSLYSQMIGRGTRLYPGKKDLLILDFLWMTQKHDLCRPASLMSSKEDVVKRATKKLESGEETLLTDDFFEEIERDVMAEREAALAEELRKQRRKKRALVDPLQYAFSIMDTDLTDYEPEFGWQSKPATDKQLSALEKFGIDSSVVQNVGQASLLMDKLINRSRAGLATPKQIRKLESYGFQHVGQWTKDDASKMMSRIALNRWVVPRGIIPQEYSPR